LITEDATEKVLQFIMTMKSVYSKNLCFNEQKCMFEHWVKTAKIYIFVNKNCSDYLFRAAIYELILVLFKD